MTLRLAGSTSGYTEIDAPAVAGSNTLVLPTGNGTSGQVLQTNGSGALSWTDRMTAAGPTFIAYKSGANQAVSANTSTKITYATELFDTANCYDTSASRFTPNVAGFYQVTANVEALAVTGSYFVAQLLKSGNIVMTGTSYPTSPSGGPCTVVSTLLYLNGTTDYVEIFAQCSASISVVAGASENYTPKFSAVLVRPA
jgi:hypothetical protein